MTTITPGWPSVPFEETHELNNDLSNAIMSRHPGLASDIKLPGNPRINLGMPSVELAAYMEQEFRTPELDAMAPYLWLMTSQSSAHITALHRQRVKGREIIITEDPRLHLLWIDDRIFIKPLPAYLLSHAFWTAFLLPPDSKSGAGPEEDLVFRSALGYLRSYAYLIRHPSDFDMALKHGLIPPSVTFEAFCLFSLQFLDILDADVSQRYCFGEMRLSRLNMWCKIFLRRWHYMHVYRQYGAYFQRWFGPLLFVFGSLSVILNAIQVEIAAEPLVEVPWGSFRGFARYFSVASLCLTGLACFFLLLLLVGKLSEEFFYATRTKIKLSRQTVKSN